MIALKDQTMDDPNLARVLPEALRNPWSPVSAASGEPNEEDLAEIKSAVLTKLALAVGKDAASATDRDWFVATALAIRD